VPLEKPDQQHVRSADGYIELGMFARSAGEVNSAPAESGLTNWVAGQAASRPASERNISRVGPATSLQAPQLPFQLCHKAAAECNSSP